MGGGEVDLNASLALSSSLSRLISPSCVLFLSLSVYGEAHDLSASLGDAEENLLHAVLRRRAQHN